MNILYIWYILSAQIEALSCVVSQRGEFLPYCEY